jgi:hypothetical protein
VTNLRYSRSGAGLACATLLIGSVFLLIPMTSSFAAPSTPPATARVAAVDLAKTAEADAPTTGSIKAAEEDDAGCYRTRRKLWVDGEGWIVRRVTLCR